MYLLVDSGKIRHPDEVARLLSPTFAFTGLPRCLGFSYNVYGPSVGELNIRDEKLALLWQYVGVDVTGILAAF